MGAVMLLVPINAHTLPQCGPVSSKTGIREVLGLPKRLAIRVPLWVG